jgi:hypothetical protein
MSYSFLEDAWAPIEHFTQTPTISQPVETSQQPIYQLTQSSTINHNNMSYEEAMKHIQCCPFCNKKSVIKELLLELNSIIENNRDVLIVILISICIYLFITMTMK